MTSHWEDFYAKHLPPNCFEDNRSLLKEFCDRHYKLKSHIVLVTVIVVFSRHALLVQVSFFTAVLLPEVRTDAGEVDDTCKESINRVVLYSK